ncbi:DUF6850 family outer membrane beta-barrel protein [Chryseobacterium taiwanense]|uniref:DUF6850 domain-containing protein n=1 Tax=Chryseobacterium taiwanense TaxID=363331 RepID=A0A0B4E4I7_9FLAO|nr:DUF6850 family outer membrane beta-barrel protein [Chryseobacterium taiwanense]KIC61528.1 hypothetical protein RM51_17100 [Chryseobacterium taiwanense]
MKFKSFYIISFLSFGCASAQLNDSIFIPTNQIYYQQLNRIWDNPIQFSKQKFSDFTETELSAVVKDLSMRRTQTAESSNEFGFKTQGVFNISKKLRLLGSFDYQFVTEKNLGYNLTNGRTEDQFVLNPNYLFVPKKANWETQNYHVKGGLSYNLWKGLEVGATVDYRNQSSYRKSDPRPEINTADYSGKIFAGYRYLNHQVSIFGGLGRKSDTYDVMAVNEAVNAPANPEYYVRFSNGYGRIVYFPSYGDYGYRTVDRNFGAGYTFENQKNFFNINFSYSKAMQNLYGNTGELYGTSSTSGTGSVYFAESLEKMKYRLVNYKTDANYWYKGDKIDFMSNVNFQSITGDNYNNAEFGQNYRMTLDRVSTANHFLLREGKKIKFGTTLEGIYNDFSAIDLLGITYKYVKSLNLNLKFNKDIFYRDTQKVNLEIGAMSYFPLSESLTYVPASSNTLLYDNVIKNDHEYDATSKLGPQFGLQFYQKVTSKTDLKIFTNFATLFPLSKDLEKNTDYSGNPSLYFNAGISLFY